MEKSDGDIENLQNLKSPPAKIESFAKFYNNTKYPVTIIWIDCSGHGIVYIRNLPSKRWYDVNTFADHKWIFLRSGTHERLAGNGKFVWSGEPWTNNCGNNPNQARRRLVIVGTPVYSLKECCINIINRQLARERQSAESLRMLPRDLIEDLRVPIYRNFMPFRLRARPVRDVRNNDVRD
ncbi:von Hippel-Lindau tumor suppressor homolog [Watersipora subatra]|uniref:von Hippel-Lindau tumor suppressor homolog n=1 Tax=Watersipora subatra TaxID=2589382 RepID=UPI00355C3756